MIRVAFLITDRLYSSERGVCGAPMILLAWLTVRESLVLCLDERRLYQEEMLKVSRGVRESQGQGDQYASTGTRRRLTEGGLETISRGGRALGPSCRGRLGGTVGGGRQSGGWRLKSGPIPSAVRQKGRGEGVDAEGRANGGRAHHSVEGRGTKPRQKEGGVDLSITMPSVKQSRLSGRGTRRKSGRVGGRTMGAPMC